MKIKISGIVLIVLFLFISPCLTTYAQEQIMVRYDCNGGEEVSPSGKFVSTGDVYGALPIPVRKGCKFYGWNTKANGKGDYITITSTVAQTEDHVLYAIWKKNGKIVKSKPASKKGSVSYKWYGNGTIRIKFQKVAAASGYQIKYSTSKKFKKNRTKMLKVVGNNEIIYIHGLKKGTYYVRVRAYQKRNGKIRYGKWSTAKKIKSK